MSHVTFQEGAKKLQLSIVSCFCFESGCLSVKERLLICKVQM